MCVSASGSPSVDFGPWSANPTPQRTIAIIGETAERLWGLTPTERVRRIAARRAMPVVSEDSRPRAQLYVNGRYVFEPGLIDWCAAAVGRAVLDGAIPVIVFPEAADRNECAQVLANGSELSTKLVKRLEKPEASFDFRELSKKTPPFVTRLTAANSKAAHRASFAAAYRGVADLVTTFIWPAPAYLLTRAFATARVKPNTITMISMACCLAAAVLWCRGDFWSGLLVAVLYMLLDTVDGKLARCTIASSRLGDVLDHGTDLLAPLILWSAWAVGARDLDATSKETVTISWALMVALYLVQRAIEGAFVTKFGFQLHHWRPFDSAFKLVASQRNIQVVVVGLALAVVGPARALAIAAAWALVSTTVHAARYVHAIRLKSREVPIRRWLSAT